MTTGILVRTTTGPPAVVMALDRLYSWTAEGDEAGLKPKKFDASKIWYGDRWMMCSAGGYEENVVGRFFRRLSGESKSVPDGWGVSRLEDAIRRYDEGSEGRRGKRRMDYTHFPEIVTEVN